MPDWTKSMQQTFEYYTVNPFTWEDDKKLEKVRPSSTIDWDSEANTLGSATIDMDETIGECYVRIYMITIQNGVTEKHTLGTFLVQTEPTGFDGTNTTISVDAYTPLLELKEKYPPIGFYVPKKTNIMDAVYSLTRENMRAPVVKPSCDETLFIDYVADPDKDTWLVYLKELMSNAKYEFSLDESGRVLFAPKQDLASLQPVWTFTDDENSIFYPDVKKDKDLYGIPNVVEIVCSDGVNVFHHIVENNDADSPTSIVNRGRRIEYRETNPSIIGTATDERVKEYAKAKLKELSSVVYTVSYRHGYCPVRVGDCVRLNYVKGGLDGVKAKVVSQSISCEPGCPVSETAVFTSKLWG